MGVLKTLNKIHILIKFYVPLPIKNLPKMQISEYLKYSALTNQ